MLLVRSVRLDLWEFVCLARLISAFTQMIGKDGCGRLLDARAKAARGRILEVFDAPERQKTKRVGSLVCIVERGDRPLLLTLAAHHASADVICTA